MIKNFAKGFAIGIGFVFGKSCVHATAKRIAQHFANDDEYMAKQKECDPDWYNCLLTYRTKP